MPQSHSLQSVSSGLKISPADAGKSARLPLVVDLDGTLIKTDLLVESASQFLTRQPFQFIRLLGWLVQGKSSLKAALAESTGIDAATLPYNEDLLIWLKQEKASGRQLVLATASHRILAERVAIHLGIFDEILATEGATNLTSKVKRDVLVERYGSQGFDYVGNSQADIAVWGAAARAHIVGGSPRLIAKAMALGNIAQVFGGGKRPVLQSLLNAMRPHQWLKNLLVLVPLLAAHRYGSQESVADAVMAFVVFSLIASSVYLINDLVDVSEDRNHNYKRRRAFASGDLDLAYGWLAWPLLVLIGFGMATLFLPARFLAAIFIYFALTTAYSLWLKKIALVDALTLAVLYTLRVIAGAAAIDVPLSFWLLSFSMFLFLSLALVKRFSELWAAQRAGENGKIGGRGYYSSDLELISSLGTAAGYIAVLVLALYIQDSHTGQLYRTPEFIWLACPLVLYWVSRVWLLANRGVMHDDPVIFALRDRTSWLVWLLLSGVFVLARVM